MFSRYLLLIFVGISSGLFVSGGVFTILLSVGLVPRFAGKTHTANKIFLFEEMVIFGLLFGVIISIFLKDVQLAQLVIDNGIVSEKSLKIISTIISIVFGFFAGIFVGSLAIAIAEMLDSIPIFARRISFHKGLGIIILVMAIGKAIGSIIYFVRQM